jgi:hypothetical protein
MIRNIKVTIVTIRKTHLENTEERQRRYNISIIGICKE